MHITSPAKKKKKEMHLGIGLCLQCDNSGILSSLFPKSKCLCHSLARRGQPCIMPALTAMQLHRIQSLDKSQLKPLRTVHRVCF